MPEPRHFLALVVGVGDYLHAKSLPPGVVAGARKLAAVLADPELGGYEPQQVLTLFGARATREALEEKLRCLAAFATAESTVLIYFAGHGGRSADGGEDVHLFTAEADDRDAATLARTALSGTVFLDAVAAVPARRVLVVFDCCHAGGLGDVELPPAAGEPLPDAFHEHLVAGRGRVILAAARADERSWLPDADRPSLFTDHLVQALRGAAPGRGGWIRVWDLFEHLQPKVTAVRGDQHPIFRGELEENFPVARYLGGRGGREEGDGDGELPYDAYLSYAEADADVVWGALVPELEAAGLEVAVSGDVEEPGVYRVVAAERGIRRARRTVIVLSDAYLEQEMNAFVDAMAQTLGLDEGRTRLLPVRFAPVTAGRLPLRLGMLVELDLGHPHPRRRRRNFNRLVQALHAPLRAAG